VCVHSLGIPADETYNSPRCYPIAEKDSPRVAPLPPIAETDPPALSTSWVNFAMWILHSEVLDLQIRPRDVLFSASLRQSWNAAGETTVMT
jgi:hypothetical protein